MYSFKMKYSGLWHFNANIKLKYTSRIYGGSENSD